MTWLRVLSVFLAACSVEGSNAPVAELGSLHDPHGDPGGAPEPPVQAKFENPGAVRFHMARHFDDLHTIEQDVVAGDLDDAKALGFGVAQPAIDPGMAPWERESKQVTDAAMALANAPSLDEACRRAARVAVACANCHLHAGKLPTLAPPPPLPRDQPGVDARMARHQWAVDRLWEGMVMPSDAQWRRGLEVLAETPLPFSAVTQHDAQALADRLQALAREQLATSGDALLDTRAAAYGEMLVTCTGCHATPRSK